MYNYADDTQIYVEFNKNCLASMQLALYQLEQCYVDISCWVSQNGLNSIIRKLNGSYLTLSGPGGGHIYPPLDFSLY